MNALLLVLSCHFVQLYPTDPRPTTECIGMREEAEDYLAKSHQSCAAVVYITMQGKREHVRCRGYDGSTLDYISDDTGNLKFTR
jgi:hypothetical protein